MGAESEGEHPRGSGSGVPPGERPGAPASKRAPGLEQLVARARDGDREALEGVVLAIQDRVYGLALRMLWHPAELDEGPADAPEEPPSPERALLLEEVKVGCTLALLSCLDRPHRLAYVLGEILELEGPEAARVLEISPAALRKRLQRARAEVIRFTSGHCGLVRPDRPCRCHRRLPAALAGGRVDPERPLFATDARHARRFPGVLTRIRQLEEARRTAALYRSHPEPRAPREVEQGIRALLAGL